MQSTVLFIGASIVVAALIGGMTNHLAIKMLFHPRSAWYLFGQKVPFTPGLIPKRREEIGRSLGQVVSNYLVTSKGLAGMLRMPAFHEKVNEMIKRRVQQWTLSEQTIKELLTSALGDQRYDDFVKGFALWLSARTADAAEWVWRDGGLSAMRVSALVPGWGEEKKAAMAAKGADFIAEEMKKELQSLSGDRLIRSMTAGFMEQAGGLLGALAGMFMDEDKLSLKVRTILHSQLDSPLVRIKLEDFVRLQLDRMEQTTLSEAASWMEAETDIREQLGKITAWDLWLAALGDKRPSDWLVGNLDWINERIPGITETAIQAIDHNLDRILAAIELPHLVETQVSQFPIERLEDIILSVSGKEFRMITWLGACIGGFIGLLQSIVVLWMFW